MAEIIQMNLVKDDNDAYWVYGNGNIRCVGDDSEEGGYPCRSFFDGIGWLLEYGYIENDPEIPARLASLTLRETDQPSAESIAAAKEAVYSIENQ